MWPRASFSRPSWSSSVIVRVVRLSSRQMRREPGRNFTSATEERAKELRAVVEGPDYNDYGVSADGQRFLVKRLVDTTERPRNHVLLDWPSLLK
jgi:hypothetical protein